MENEIIKFLESRCLGERREDAIAYLQIKFYLDIKEAREIYNNWRRSWCDTTKKES
ncbi:hypothetical protein [Clostridium perfringens]|uniref:hypothetical protein n=1 Tax=Clostridium perfringens TaxID=1502 RepID=UPI003A1002F8